MLEHHPQPAIQKYLDREISLRQDVQAEESTLRFKLTVACAGAASSYAPLVAVLLPHNPGIQSYPPDSRSMTDDRNYAVLESLAQGDRCLDLYCWAGRMSDKRLQQLNGAAFLDICEHVKRFAVSREASPAGQTRAASGLHAAYAPVHAASDLKAGEVRTSGLAVSDSTLAQVPQRTSTSSTQHTARGSQELSSAAHSVLLAAAQRIGWGPVAAPQSHSLTTGGVPFDYRRGPLQDVDDFALCCRADGGVPADVSDARGSLLNSDPSALPRRADHDTQRVPSGASGALVDADETAWVDVAASHAADVPFESAGLRGGQEASAPVPPCCGAHEPRRLGPLGSGETLL